MKTTLSIAVVAAFMSLASGAAMQRRSCIDGSYAVKIETHTAPDCGDTGMGGSATIANYGGVGPCIDTLDGHNFLKAFNDGCSSSSIDLHCYGSAEECNADIHGSLGNPGGSSLTPGSCGIAPPNCQYIRVVAG